MTYSAEDADEFAEWQARQKAARPAGVLYRVAWRVQSFVVAFWTLVFVVLLTMGEVEAALPFAGLALIQGLVLLIVRRYRPR